MKNDSWRRVPLHPEILRLGFREYVDGIRAADHEDLFPDLRARGTATALAALFDKKWTVILDEALPDARGQKKTIHSLRKSGNNELHNSGVNDTLCKDIMGHEQDGVNARVYLDSAADKTKLDTLLRLQNVSAEIAAHSIDLTRRRPNRRRGRQ